MAETEEAEAEGLAVDLGHRNAVAWQEEGAVTGTGVDYGCCFCSVVGLERIAVAAGKSEQRVLEACMALEGWREGVQPEERKVVDTSLLEVDMDYTQAVVEAEVAELQGEVVENAAEAFVAVAANADFHNHSSHTTLIVLEEVVAQLVAVVEEPATGDYMLV